MKKPWYIIEYEQKEYLRDKRLQLREFVCNSDQHEHCEICWARFGMHPEDLHFGYYESHSKSWICNTCYNDFKDLFKWVIEE